MIAVKNRVKRFAIPMVRFGGGWSNNPLLAATIKIAMGNIIVRMMDYYSGNTPAMIILGILILAVGIGAIRDIGRAGKA